MLALGVSAIVIRRSRESVINHRSGLMALTNPKPCETLKHIVRGESSVKRPREYRTISNQGSKNHEGAGRVNARAHLNQLRKLSDDPIRAARVIPGEKVHNGEKPELASKGKPYGETPQHK